MKQQKINKIEHRIHLHPQSQHYHHHHRHPLQRLNPPKPQYPYRRLHGRSRRKHMLEPNIAGIKAILPGNFRDIFRIREFDIHALHTLATLQPNQTRQTRKNIHYTKQPHAAPSQSTGLSHDRQSSHPHRPATAPEGDKPCPGTAHWLGPRWQTASPRDGSCWEAPCPGPC